MHVKPESRHHGLQTIGAVDAERDEWRKDDDMATLDGSHHAGQHNAIRLAGCRWHNDGQRRAQ